MLLPLRAIIKKLQKYEKHRKRTIDDELYYALRCQNKIAETKSASNVSTNDETKLDNIIDAENKLFEEESSFCESEFDNLSFWRTHYKRVAQTKEYDDGYSTYLYNSYLRQIKENKS